MDFPQRNDSDNNDGPGRPPRKAVQDSLAEEDQNNVVEAFGDTTDLPLVVFLFMAALFAEHFRRYYACGC